MLRVGGAIASLAAVIVIAAAGCRDRDSVDLVAVVPDDGGVDAAPLTTATEPEAAGADAADVLPPPPVLHRSSPPMGWNTWNHFKCGISEELIRQSAEALVTTGLRDAGYQYVVIDDCWAEKTRNAGGALQPDPTTFPSGIAALADYVHARGLKLGIYTAAGDLTCKSRTGSYDHEEQDARTFASWGVDFVKEDWCSAAKQKLVAPTQYGIFAKALEATGRDMVFSVCTAGADWPVEWAPALSAMWRTTADLAINPSFAGMLSNFYGSSWFAGAASHGHANDPDILEIGNGTMTPVEEKTHLSLWAISAAPLMLGNDLRSMSAHTIALAGNSELIAIDQDRAGIPASLAASSDGVQVWARPLEEPGTRAVVVFNSSGDEIAGKLDWASIGLEDGPASVRDVWAHADRGSLTSYLYNLASHDVAMLVIRGHDAGVPAGGEWSVSTLPWTYATTGQGGLRRDEASEGGAMRIAGVTYERGLGVHAESVITFDLAGRCSSFSATVGVDDEGRGVYVPGPTKSTGGTVTFEVWTDGSRKLDTGVVMRGAPASRISVDVQGARSLRLVVTGAGDSTTGDTADWADAVLDCR